MFQFVPCFVFNTLCRFYFCHHLDGEKRAGCFTLIVFLMSENVIVLLLFLTVPWVGLQCVIEVFLDHTHFCHKNIILMQAFLSKNRILLNGRS